MPDYDFYRGKLPRDQAYPLTRTALDAALTSARVTSLRSVHFGWHSRNREVLRAIFIGESRGSSGAPQRFLDHAGTLVLTVYGVPMTDRAEVAAALLQTGLANLCTWLRRAEIEGNVWRATMHHYVVSYANGTLRIEEA